VSVVTSWKGRGVGRGTGLATGRGPAKTRGRGYPNLGRPDAILKPIPES